MRASLLTIASALSVFLMTSFSSTADAQPRIPVQGMLSTADGSPIDENLDVTFRLYANEGTLAEVWFEVQNVSFERGFFTAYLGENITLNPALLSEHESLWLGIAIADDEEMAPFEIGMAPYAGYALSAGDARTLGGRTADEIIAASGGGGGTSDWTALTNVPASLADGDQDTLASLSCTEGMVPVMSGGAWTCGASSGGGPSSVDSVAIANYTITDADISPSANIDPTKISGTAATLQGSQNFDGDTLRIDAVNNRIGIGTPSPTTSLDVTGDITVSGRVVSRTTQTRHVTIPATVFTMASDNEDDYVYRSSSGYMYMTDGTSTYNTYQFAPVQLPDGATVTNFTCYAYDSHSTEDLTGYVRLYRKELTSTGSQTMATATYTTSGLDLSEVQATEDNSISYAEVDNALYTYYAYLYFYTGTYTGSLMRFYGCRVTYETDEI